MVKSIKPGVSGLEVSRIAAAEFARYENFINNFDQIYKGVSEHRQCVPGPTGVDGVQNERVKAAVLSEVNNLPSTKTDAELRVQAGQVTFDAEGNDIASSPYFSRVVHWPGNSLSGVTIGRGYDLGNRTQDDVYADLIRAGVPSTQAIKIAKGAQLKGSLASEFVKDNKSAIGEISHEQQVRLFDLIYPSYVQRARNNYDSWTATENSRVLWDNLFQKIRDILVDFVYQGFTKGPNPMKAGMTNESGTLILYIESSTTMKQFEPGRRRAAYLREA